MSAKIPSHPRQTKRTDRARNFRVFFAVALALGLTCAKSRAVVADEFWRTDGHTGDTWTSNDWNIGSANSTGGTGWTNGNNALFTANSSLTAASVSVGNITVSPGVTVTIAPAGTVTLGTSTLNIGAGGILNWSGQTFSATGKITVNGGGVLTLGASTLASAAGFEVDGSTVNAGGTALGTGAVTLNGGTINGSSLNLAGAVALTGTGNLLTGTVTLAGSNTVTAGSSSTINGSITGTTTASAGSFAITGNNATLTNLGTINQTATGGNGRIIRDNTGVTGLVINNGSATNSTAVMQTADADVIQMNKAGGSVILNNYGTMNSLNASAGGSQAVDFNAITTGSNIINNFSTGIMIATEADAVRPGVNGVVNNDGLIKSTTTTGSSSDGIDAQTNSGIVIVNAASAGSGTGTGMIEGGRHGITGGNTTGSGAYTMSITNNLGGTIQGDNGAGINIDGINGNEVVTIVNHGTIIGHGVTGDGDGVDVDGIVNLTNTGTIKSLNSFTPTGIEFSEGVTVGGGTIINSGLIEGSVTPGNNSAIGRGITIAGVDKDALGNPIPPQAPYVATTIINSGTIKGDSDSAIVFSSPLSSGFTHTITNLAGGLIVTGSLTAPTILTSADNVIINNSGKIDGSSSGQAITGGSGNNTVNILGGAASILGNVNGGVGGKNSLLFDVGFGNGFSYSGSFSNFSTVEVRSGTVELSGVNTYTAPTMVTGGALFVDGSIASPNTSISPGALIGGHGTIGGNLVNSGFVSPGNSPGTLTVNGNYTQSSTGTLVIEVAALAPSGHDLLAVKGSATLAGTLDLVALNNFHLLPGDKLTFLTAGGGINGGFSTINSTFTDTLVGAQVSFVGNEIDIVGVPAAVTSIPKLTPNEKAVAQAVDAGFLNPRNANLVARIYGETLDKVVRDLDRISPDQLTSIYQIAVAQSKVQTFNLERRLEDVRAGSNGFSASGFAMNGAAQGYSGPLGDGGSAAGPEGKGGKELVAPPADTRWGAFVTGTGEWVNVDGDGNGRGYDLTSAGFTLGLDYKLTDHFVVGLAAGYDRSDTDLSNSGRLTVDGGKIALYSSYFTGKGLYFNGAVQGGYNSYDSDRAALGGFAREKTDGGELSVLAGTGYDWKIGGLTFGPTANFEYTYVGISGSTESGSLAPLDIAGQHQESIRTTFGMKATYDWKIGNVLVRPELHVGWQHEYGSTAFDLSSSLANGASPEFVVQGPDTGRDSFIVNCGVAVQLNERVSTYVYYDGELGRTNYTANSVSGGFRIDF